MATPVLVPVSEYLNTTYRPDCDYVDGEVRERNLGERPHATVQGYFVAIFFNMRQVWQVQALPEQRIQISKTRYRIADVCVLRLIEANDPIVLRAPLICIEILSRDQTLAHMQERVADYLAMGVENIWLVDPRRRQAWIGTHEGFLPTPNGAFSVENTPIEIAVADVFDELDNLLAGRL